MKRFLLIITISITSLLSSSNILAASSGKCGDNVVWSLTDDGKLFINGTGKMYDYDHNINSYEPPFTSKYIKSIYINNGITHIGSDAFYNCSNVSITIPNSVTSIGSSAFCSCNALKRVDISDFDAWCKINFVNADSNPLNYAHHLFFNGEEITELKIPNWMIKIPNYLFTGGSWTSVIIPNSVTYISSYAFNNCTSLYSVLIPNSVTYIGSYAFNNCTSLFSVPIPNSVTSIGSYAFNGCSNLPSVSISNSIISIGSGAFCGCDALKRVDISDFDAWCKINFVNADSNPLNYAHHLFLNGKEITELKIPNWMTKIPNYLFAGGNWTSVIISNSVTRIGDHAFNGCSNLSSVSIPNSVTSIGDYAFNSCSSLLFVSIPNSVTNIGSYAFEDCRALKKIDCLALTPPNCGDYTFYNIRECYLYVPQESMVKYATTSPWNKFIILAGVNDVNRDEVTVSAKNGEIVVEGVSDDAVIEIYCTNGQLLYQGTDKTVKAPTTGIYIIKVDGKTVKISV